ncbi:hypothetical protein BDZ45DRAFT_741542 [Acephala macrosclerotiorum]|nr:hypothetical protein BDZ45DRAFT_741542 [Acephala macrosclerotiorum]
MAGWASTPWATFDWSVADTGILVTPFFSAIQQYGARAFSGIIIVAMYYSNFSWSAYTPINSNELFTNNGTVTRVTDYCSIRYKNSAFGDNDDLNSRMMRGYPEVADWRFIAVLLISLVLVVGLSAVFLIPSALLLANANVTMGFDVLFQLLAGYWFVGNSEALIIVTAYGQNFNSRAENYISDQKMGL